MTVSLVNRDVPSSRFDTHLDYSGADTTHEERCLSLKGFSVTGCDEGNNLWDLMRFNTLILVTHIHLQKGSANDEITDFVYLV